MSLRLLMALFLILSGPLWAEDFAKVCQGPLSEQSDLSVFNCAKSDTSAGIQMIQKLSGEIGKTQCKFLNIYLKKDRIQLNDFMIFDKKRGSSRPLSCYCKELAGEGICNDKDEFSSKLEVLNKPFQVKAWGNFVKDLFEVSIRGGESCIDELREQVGAANCFSKLDELHKKAQINATSMEFSGKDLELFKAEDVDKLLLGLKDFTKTKDNEVFEPESSYLQKNKSNDVQRFEKGTGSKRKEFFDLNSSSYEKKMEELGQKLTIQKFLEVLRSAEPEESLRAYFKGGIDFFAFNSNEVDDDLLKRMTLAMHPDLKWLFSGIMSFSNADRLHQRDKFLKLATLANENEFASLKELRLLYEEKHGAECSSLKKKVVEVCQMDTSQTLGMAKELMSSKKMENVKVMMEDDGESLKLFESTLEELGCFEFPLGYETGESDVFDLVARSNDPKEMLDRSVNPVSITEAKVDLAVTKIRGMEDVAKRIEKVKAEGKNPAEGIALDLKFRDYLSKLELPDGGTFSYSGDDLFQGINQYKQRVYDWADEAVEERLSEIQGETEAIVKSNDSPAVKKAKLERLMNEVQRLNDGDFLKEVFEQKQAIADQIARYEDEKRNWESQYGDEAKKDPKAVRPVAPSKEQIRSARKSGGGGLNSYKQVSPMGSSTVSSAPGTAASFDETVAYLPPRPSVPYAQGSLLTRIVPKDEFSNNTVKANLLAKHKGYPIAVLDEKKLQVELYTPRDGTSYKLQETLSIDEAEARGYVFPDDIKKLVESYRKDKVKGRAPASFVEYEPTKEELAKKKKKLSQLASLADTMERQGVPRRARVVRLNNLLDSL